jgi:hypothetical protein
MSVSISWRVVKPAQARPLPGTSNDWKNFEEVFDGRTLTQADIPILRAMHFAAGHASTLWGELADIIINLPEGTEIEVFAEW